MKFIWAEGKEKIKNLTFAFLYKGVKNGDEFRLAAGDFYRVFINGRFMSFGPSRTAAGYSRVRNFLLGESGVLVVEVVGYNTACYSNDKADPFFGAELIRNGQKIADSDDFICMRLNDRISRAERYSYQRNYVEVYAANGDRSALYNGDVVYPCAETAEVSFPVELLDSGDDAASYERIVFSYESEKKSDMSELKPNKLWWSDYIGQGKMEGYLPDEYEFDFGEWIKNKTALRKTYTLHSARTGFIQADLFAEKDGFAVFVFDEYSFSESETDIRFQRTCCNDYVVVKLKKGLKKFLSFEPYELKYLQVYLSEGVEISGVSLIAFENKTVTADFICDDADIKTMFDSAVNTFKQNALDIFMDCPGRERAGWLCDSYFTAQAEALLCGSSETETRFLENFFVGSYNEIPEGMVPMCFPSELYEKVFIPNWAMWFLLELESFAKRSEDKSLLLKLKGKAYKLLDYFRRFENEYGLLENLEGWIFVEWSVANDPSHVCGVNIPSNMLYAKALDSVATVYNDLSLKQKARNIRETVIKLGFDGKVFRDNLVRREGKLVLSENYSETCQYYAIFCGLSQGKEFEDFLLEKYGAEDAGSLPEASNMLTGHCLRLMWLLERKERERFFVEAKRVFLNMAKRTGTLWENDTPSASCNHGFTSVLTVLLADALFGYKGYDATDKSLIFSDDYCDKYDCGLSLNVFGGKLSLSVKNGKRTIINDTGFKIESSDTSRGE